MKGLLLVLLLAPPVDLVDVMPEHWAASAVAEVVEIRKVMSAYPDHTFRGTRPTSRYVALASLKRVMEESGRVFTVPGPVPKDVPGKHWAYPALRALSGQALFQAWLASSSLQGDKPITRLDLAKLLAETIIALNMPQPFSSPPVVDDERAVMAVRYGLMSVGAEGKFQGELTVTRYELAATLQRLLERLVPPPAL